MLCEFQIISRSPKGKMIKCSKCDNKIALMYNNITQSFSMEDFYKLKQVIDKVDIEYFFQKNPTEEKLHIRTDLKSLYFSFTKEELIELRGLMGDADLKIKLHANLKNNFN